MRMIFDIDETLVSGDIVAAVSQIMVEEGSLSKIYTNRDVKTFDLQGIPDSLRKRVNEAFSDPEFVWYKRPVVGSWYFLKAAETQGHKIGALTSRPITTWDATKRFMKSRFPGVDWELGLYDCNSEDKVDTKRVSKVGFLEKLKPDIYFDDCPKYCKEAASLGIETYLVANKHTPWNQDISDSRIRILRNVAFFPEERIYGGME